MIYAMIMGNAGNQFFQYAFARKMMIEKNDELTLDMRYILHGDNVHKAENVLKYFNVVDYMEDFDGHYKIVPRYIYALLIRILPTRTSKYAVIRYTFLKCFAKILSRIGLYFYDGSDYIDYKFNERYPKDLYLKGFWECDKYFNDIRDIILQELVPKYPVREENQALYRKIKERESICVTVRRYDKEDVHDGFFSCDVDYFCNGVEYIKKRYPDAAVFVFSDDVEWCRNNLDFGADTFYESGKDPIWEKVRLMSSCKHFVISNSTFSWWVQYLSINEKKIVISPLKWRHNECIPIDIYQDSWIYLDEDGNEIGLHM